MHLLISIKLISLSLSLYTSNSFTATPPKKKIRQKFGPEKCGKLSVLPGLSANCGIGSAAYLLSPDMEKFGFEIKNERKKFLVLFLLETFYYMNKLLPKIINWEIQELNNQTLKIEGENLRNFLQC